MENLTVNTTPEKPSTSWKTFVAVGAFAGLAAANGFLFWRGSTLESELDMMRSATSSELAAMRHAAGNQAESARRTIEELNGKLQQSQANSQRYAATAARQSADKAVKQAEALVQNLAEQNKTAQKQVVEEIGQMKQAAESTSGKIGEVSTEVNQVKSEVATTRSSLDATIAELKSVRGDLGVQSGLIATNARELAALRELGDRNYYEFSIARSSPPVKLAGVAVTLKKVDTKRNKFNIDLLADDRHVEKKDKTLNEPVQFYVTGGRQPFEIVVNQIGKDRISGYLATPKLMQASR